MSRTPATSDRRIEILKSAAAAFRRRGYHGASVDEIASALEMTKGNLYYYFKNKEEILFACHEYSLDKLLALMSDVQAESTSPEAKLRRLVLAFVHLILDDLHGTALTLDPEALSPPLLKRLPTTPRSRRRPARCACWLSMTTRTRPTRSPGSFAIAGMKRAPCMTGWRFCPRRKSFRRTSSCWISACQAWMG